jgi:hypothetical protein
MARQTLPSMEALSFISALVPQNSSRSLERLASLFYRLSRLRCSGRQAIAPSAKARAYPFSDSLVRVESRRAGFPATPCRSSRLQDPNAVFFRESQANPALDPKLTWGLDGVMNGSELDSLTGCAGVAGMVH